MKTQADRQRAALKRMAAEDPELAARLILMTLPASARAVSYVLEVEGLGEHRVGEGEPAFRLMTDPRTLADLATGSSALRLMLRGRLRIRGKRRKALKLRQMSKGELDLAAVVDAGGMLDPDILYRSLPYLIDPEWTKGHEFTVGYVVTGERGGTWYVTARDGEPAGGEARGARTRTARRRSRSTPTSRWPRAGSRPRSRCRTS